jgi:hypothetical protein
MRKSITPLTYLDNSCRLISLLEDAASETKMASIKMTTGKPMALALSKGIPLRIIQRAIKPSNKVENNASM